MLLWIPLVSGIGKEQYMSKRYSNKGVNSTRNQPVAQDAADNSTKMTLAICGIALALVVVAIAVALLANGLTRVTGECDMDQVAAEINSMNASDFTETTEATEYVKITVREHGDIIVRLRSDIAPETVKNFQRLVGIKFYDGLTFHRVRNDFMIQGGDPKGDGTGNSSSTIKGEFSANGVKNDLLHIKGVLSMARGQSMNSASCQFFICDDTASHLDTNYAGFGYVVAGLEVVDSISNVQVTMNASGDEASKPIKNVIIEKIVFVTK